ncbi:MAG: substrate-binding domain-containing protein [Actinobacteria bacterium]|nr:substrate-binding domain-containing protein [Actinomycetota bacterium]MBV8563638.1 substrate-binding domain-containing protein [Actinomycetota bacterium]
MRKFSRKTIALLGVFAAVAAVVASGATASHKASAQVCVLLPDTKSSVRWVQFDAPAMAAAFKKAGVSAMITNALNDPEKQKSQAQACLAAGAKVVIETALDNGSAAAIEKLFTEKGGKAIDYDRQVTGGTASVYVTFDGKAVGEAQANGIVAAMKANGTYSKKPVVAELWGGPTDQNAFWFKSGNDAVLNPLFSSGALTKGPQQFVPDWDANNASTIFSQMLVKTNNKIDAVLAANDNIAGAVVADLKAKHLKPIPLSGQDATPQGVQYILAGWQTGTVYKYVPDEANAAAAAAVALVKGQTPKSNGFRKNGSKNEPTLALPVIWITKANYTRLFTDKFLKKSDVCVGAYAQYCK